MHTEYRWVLARLAEDAGVRVVVVTGTPPAFCVGADSAALAGHVERGGYDDGLPAELATPGHGVRPEFDHDFSFHFGLPYVLVAAVNGAAAGVGLAVALFCDLRFVSATAKLTTAAPRLGLPAEYGMSWMLPRLIGVTRANDLLLSGRVVTGAETADWGLWNGVLSDGAATVAEAAALLVRRRSDRRTVGAAHDEATGLRRPAQQRRRRRAPRGATAARRGDGHGGVSRRCRRIPGAPTPEVLSRRRSLGLA